MRSGGSSPPGSSPAWRASSATSAWPRISPRTRWSRRWSSGRRRACRTTRAPGSWARPSTRRWTACGGRRRWSARRRRSRASWRSSEEPDLAAQADDDIGDELLSLIFTACHPVLSTEARIALTLRLIGALTTAEIARAFLVSEATVAQRIVRAKRTLAAARVPIEVPGEASGRERLESVLEVVYAIFNEGYAASAGEDWMRLELMADALRLGRILVGPGAARARGARPAGADGAAGVALARADRAGRGADPAARPEPRPLGPAADPPRPDGPGARGGGRRRAGAVRPAGGDRGLPRPRPARRGHRLGADRGCSTTRSARSPHRR